MEKATKEILTEYATHLQGLTKVKVILFDFENNEFIPEYCINCKSHKEGSCSYINTHRYGIYESERWRGKYVYYCMAGFIFASAPVHNSLRLEGGVVAGPIIMGSLEDSEIKTEMNNYKDAVVMETAQVSHLSEILSATVGYGCSHDSYLESLMRKEQKKLLNNIYEKTSETQVKCFYPIKTEMKLQKLIASGDKDGASEVINELLGQIYFSSNANFELTKERVSELLVLLSRTAIEGGGDYREVFWLSSSYKKEICEIENIDELNIWLIGVINQYTRYVFDFQKVKHTDTIHKVIEYIKLNYNSKLTLEDVASSVFLSKSYLSKIFKDETGDTIVNYMNKVRVEKSKIALLDEGKSLIDVAHDVGFEDQSYFTKVFKSIVGMSPGRYREQSKFY